MRMIKILQFLLYHFSFQPTRTHIVQRYYESLRNYCFSTTAASEIIIYENCIFEDKLDDDYYSVNFSQ